MSDLILAPDNQAEAIMVLGNSLYPGARPESIAMVLSYCRINGLDPMLKPVHIVPTSIKVGPDKWEMRDVLMPGIADYRVKASRSGEYVGKSEPEFGPDKTLDLGGTTVTFPDWCRITVKRLVQGRISEFTAKEYWLENYASAGSKTEAPNRMWLKRKYGQLAKCSEAQALRMAFPEFSGGAPTAEEMEGKTEGDFSGTTIDAKPSHPLDEENGTKWLKNLDAILAQAASVSEITDISAHPSVAKARANAPSLIKERIADMVQKARGRFTVEDAPIENAPEHEPVSEVAAFRARVEAMGLQELNRLDTNAAHKAWLKGLTPPDYEEVAEAIAGRLQALRGGA